MNNTERKAYSMMFVDQDRRQERPLSRTLFSSGGGDVVQHFIDATHFEFAQVRGSPPDARRVLGHALEATRGHIDAKVKDRVLRPTTQRLLDSLCSRSYFPARDIADSSVEAVTLRAIASTVTQSLRSELADLIGE